MSHLVRMLGGAVVVSVMLSMTGGPAVAKPPAKPGAPTDLKVVETTKSGSTFAVKATWSAGTNATKYAVRLTSAGEILDSATVTTLSWTGHTTRLEGTPVQVSVTSYNGRRRGGTATTSYKLPDVTAPTASYAVTQDPAPRGPNVTVAVSSLADNVTPTAGISQVIDWDDPTSPAPVTWNPGQATISHTYPDAPGRYEAKVTLEDQAHNKRTYQLVIVVNDGIQPTGSFALATGSAWAGWTKVSLKQTDIGDNLSPDDKIRREISWGDGTQTVSYGTTPTHVYANPGPYSPTVVLTDEAGNSSAALETSTVTVKADTVKPVLRLTPPRTRKAYVASWRTLKGRAGDAQTGVRNVVLKAIEKRGKVWYAYKANTRSWVKAKSKSAAWKRAVAANVRPTTAKTWSVKLAHLQKGRLLYKARAYDNRANASVWVSKRARLTKR
jgi:hypothetical protein